MKAEFEVITPEIAAKMLDGNVSNRKLRPKKVEQYCRDLRAGRFVTTHQGIGVYENSILADGQHRLMAIVKTGIPARMLVVRGIPYDKDTILAIDSGSSRSVTDSSSISGERVSASDKAVCIWLETYGKNFQSRNGFTHHEIVSVYKKFNAELAFIKRIFPKNIQSITITPVKVAFCKAWSDGAPEEFIISLAEYLKTGMPFDGCGRGEIKLRDDLLSKKHNSGSDSESMQNRVYKMLMRKN